MPPKTVATREQVAAELEADGRQVYWTQGKGRPKMKGRGQKPLERRNRDLTGIKEPSKLLAQPDEIRQSTIVLPPGVRP